MTQKIRDLTLREVFGTPLAPGLTDDGYIYSTADMGDAYGSTVLSVTSTLDPGAMTCLVDEDAETWGPKRGAEQEFWFQCDTDCYVRIQAMGQSPTLTTTTAFKLLGDQDYFFYISRNRPVIVAATTGAATGTLRITKMSNEFSGPRYQR